MAKKKSKRLVRFIYKEDWIAVWLGFLIIALMVFF